jgi:hypothetical protein
MLVSLSRRRRTLARGLPPLLIVIVAGCGRGDGLNRVVVSGTVTLDGLPAEVGQIRFIPQGDTPGPVTISPIDGGRYESNEFGGVPAGGHRVEILVWDPKVPPPRGPGGPQRPQWAPEKYNRKSELTFEVADSGGTAIKDWNLTGATR